MLISLFLISYSFIVPYADDVSFLNKISYDFLGSLEKSGYFTFLDENEATINTNLDDMLAKLPKNIDAKITLERYVPQSGAIVLINSFTRQDSEPADEKVAVTRAIADIDNDKYYLIKMEAWYA